MKKQENMSLFHLIRRATSPYHCVEESRKYLSEHGFEEIDMRLPMKLEKGKGYYIDLYGSSLLAFRIAKDYQIGDGYHMAFAHTDFPGFRIKSNPDIVEGKYHKLNVEVYGGPILNTWLDRPLSIAGKVALKSDDIYHPKTKLVDFARPVVTIPNIAIHLDKEINKGKELNRQIDLMPLCDMNGQQLEKKSFTKVLAKEVGVEESDILDYELTVYCCEEPCMLGFEQEFISSPRLDNITSVQAMLQGLVEAEVKKKISILGMLDHEEIGSRSKKGAASQLIERMLQRIYEALGGSGDEYTRALLNSFSLSVDVAHAVHPNRKEKSDLTNSVVLNGGVAIKTASAQSYVGDCETTAIVMQLCEAAEVQYQQFYNRSDIAGGSTLGVIMSTGLPIPTQDIGVPVLAMHSARELMGEKDQVGLQKVMTKFFS